MKLFLIDDTEWRAPDPDDYTFPDPWRMPIFADKDGQQTIAYTVGATPEQAIERAQAIVDAVNSVNATQAKP